MQKDVKNLVRALSNLASWYFEAGEGAPVSGATIDTHGKLDFVTPELSRTSPASSQVEWLECSFRYSVTEGTCRACAALQPVRVRDHTGALHDALQISVETTAGKALDVFVPCHEAEEGVVLDRTQIYSAPRPSRVFSATPLPMTSEKPAEVSSTKLADAPGETPLEEPNETFGEDFYAEPATPEPPPPSSLPDSTDAQSLLLEATAEGDLLAMDEAMKHGAAVDEPLMEQTAVKVALQVGNPEALDWLLAKGASVPKLGIREWQELSQPARQQLLDVLQRWGHQAPVWLRAVQGFSQLAVPRQPSHKPEVRPWTALQRFRDQ